MKTLDDAHARTAPASSARFEMAELEQDEVARRAWLTFVVVGGGPTGVEIAGPDRRAGQRALVGRNFRRFDPTDVRVMLFDGGKEILATFGDRLPQHGASGAASAPGSRS